MKRLASITVLVSLTTLISLFSFIYGQEKVENPYFSLRIPENWTYFEYSNIGLPSIHGRDPVNYIELTPGEFGEIIIEDESDSIVYKKVQEGGVYSEISQDRTFAQNNVTLETYVKYRLNQIGTLNVTLQVHTSVGNEKAIKVYAQGINELANLKFIEYLILHDKEAYYLEYIGNVNEYYKYLPDFEAMTESFRFED